MVHWINKTLTPKRMGYAGLTGIILWAAWLVSIFLGPDHLDLAGQPVGADYVQFYAAGRTLLRGDAARLYDFSYQAMLEREIIGPGLTNYYAFITPPFFAWVFVPLALLPYDLSFVVWSLLGLGALASSLVLLHGSDFGMHRWLKWALTFFPVFATISFGQNSLLSLFLLCGVYALWQRGSGFPAGLLLSLILYKPQLALGIGILWLLDWRREKGALWGLLSGGAALAGLSFALLPDASRAYLDFSRNVLPGLPGWQTFPLWHLHTVRGFWRLLLPGAPRVADGLTLLVSVVGVAGFAVLWRQRRADQDVLFAAAICLTLWLTPHAMVYDWAILLVPALLLWRAQPDMRGKLRAVYALLWIALLLSGPLTVMQLRVWPLAVQISIPVWVWSSGYLWQSCVDPA
ncbi:MAG TPA: glycosyltransferase family 87 protein [Anaerolineae bacterium]|nr:glycosyltransferase family 87 protein [Anaerolineae bacterium]HQH38818.1 glycosyltransferase family 87 protein [Anaerolineae bacterium]